MNVYTGNDDYTPTFDDDDDSSLITTAYTSVKPHFIFILADDLGWNSLGVIDDSIEFISPRITALAKQGIYMKNFYAQEVCSPSRASLLTGRYPLSLGNAVVGILLPLMAYINLCIVFTSLHFISLDMYIHTALCFSLFM